MVTCPCCGYPTIEEYGGWEICGVCFWEDDPVQLADPTRPGGANKVSLVEGQKNYAEFGACERRVLKYVRPHEATVVDPAWRFFDPANDRRVLTSSEWAEPYWIEA
jgi:hypothetical protein